jgi:hypothetical protein
MLIVNSFTFVCHFAVLLFDRRDDFLEVEAGPTSALDMNLVVRERTSSLVPNFYNINYISVLQRHFLIFFRVYFMFPRLGAQALSQ